LIVGIRRADGSFQPQPPAETLLREGDVLMAIGTPRTLARLEALFDPERPAVAQRSSS
jgi:voltage-gated potassium channel